MHPIETMDRGSRILISGAGIAGLTCALSLGRLGFTPVVI
jgi:2-polyprenyl-6-methoxyphenol hydroxylase-like FAD-dependent oxidoreductase